MEVQTWRQVGGLAGAVVFEILGISVCHNGTVRRVQEQVAVYMRVVCPQDVKQMLLKQARMFYWKRWAAKHESEELKEGV